MRYSASSSFSLSRAQGRLIRESESRALALHGRLRVLRDASVETLDERATDALEALADYLSAALPDDLIAHVESRSGMSWSVFVGHCVSWWQSAQTPHLSAHPKSPYHPFFLTFIERLASLDVTFEGFEWNQHRRVSVELGESPLWPLFAGGGLGLLISYTSWWAPWLLMLTLGLMLGWITRKQLGPERLCGGAACGAPLPRGAERCGRCGGVLKSESESETPRGETQRREIERREIERTEIERTEIERTEIERTEIERGEAD